MAAGRRRAVELALRSVRAISGRALGLPCPPAVAAGAVGPEVSGPAAMRGGAAAALRSTSSSSSTTTTTGAARPFSSLPSPHIPSVPMQEADQNNELPGGSSLSSGSAEGRGGEGEVRAVMGDETAEGVVAESADAGKLRNLYQELSTLRRQKRWGDLLELFQGWRAGLVLLAGSWEQAWASVEKLRGVFEGMMAEDGLAPDVFAYARMLEVAQRKILTQARPAADLTPMYQLLNEMAAKEIPLNTSCYTNLIRALIHCNDFNQAQRHLTDMWTTVEMCHHLDRPRMAEMYTRVHVALLLALSRRGEYAALQKQLSDMTARVGYPNVHTALLLLDSVHAKQGSRDCASLLLDSLSTKLKEHRAESRPQDCVLVDEGLTLKWLDFAAASADSELATRAWDAFHESLAVSNQRLLRAAPRHSAPPSAYHAYIQALAASGMVEEAFRILSQLEQEHAGRPELCAPLPALNSLVNAISRSAQQVDNVFYRVEEMRNAGETVTAAMLNCIMAGCAQLSDAPRLFETFDSFADMGAKPDVNTFNTIIHGLCRTGKHRSISVALEDMAAQGISPNAHTYKLAINGLLLGRDLPRALAVLDAAVEGGVELEVETLTSVVRWCDREGEMDRVRSIMTLIRRVHRTWGRGVPDFEQLLRAEHAWLPAFAKQVAQQGGAVQAARSHAAPRGALPIR
eukprot:CAMPEP_0177793754 /NCGR_PEP_ID=MMETSP0491_2-20121128/25250_1 /TAXON_ID=63592 /ORGANISM="Tetraselmis chuii, Strain PLY429" /LENGTH=684 /DNA_ID=CAMNT_0019316303 /DNA_START=166 /DNA_END=2220 /DNA_ORIENTATION=+